MRRQTLDAFITERKSANAYVDEPGFDSLYVRMSVRFFNGVRYEDVLDLANITAERPGDGAFTRLVERLHTQGLTLYVECVTRQRFAKKLLRMGFLPANSSPDCFYMLAQEKPTNDETHQDQ